MDEPKLCPGVCNLICLPSTWLMTLFMVMHVTVPCVLDIKKTPLLMEEKHANTTSLTFSWWFTSASLLRRSSTIWSWAFQLAANNAVRPVCTCIKIKKVTFNSNHVTQHLFTATSWFCVAVMWPKVWEESGNGGTWLYNFFLISYWLHGVFPCALLSMTI